MSTEQKNVSNEEIDLSQISKRFGQAYENFLSWIFSGFLFIKRNIILVAALFILGVGLGFYMDKTSKTYADELIVVPNFGSTDYLYDKVNLINSKLKEGDSVFLQKMGIKNVDVFSSIEVEPVSDIYNFIQKEQNFELIKLMAEEGDITKIIEDETTSKNYSTHRIKIVTRAKTARKDLVDPILNYLNASNFYTKIQKSAVQSSHLKLAANERILAQIDNIIAEADKNPNGSNLVYWHNENTQMNDILQTKSALIQETANKKIDLLISDKIIKEKSSVLNVRETNSVSGRMKFIIPFVLLGLFFFIVVLLNFYTRQNAKFQNQ